MSTYLSSGSRCRTRAAGSHMAWAAGLALLGCSAGGAWAQTTLVSTSAGGLQGNGESAALSEEQLITVSADGRYVCFTSLASDLVPGDGNRVRDVFVKDRQTGAIERVSVGPAGVEGDGPSTLARMTPDARFVVFESSATNLVPGDANGQVDIFLRDRQLGTTELVSVTTGGLQAESYSRFASVSGDGRYVAFTSNAVAYAGIDHAFIDNVYMRDRQLGVTTTVTASMDGDGGNGISQRPLLSADGSVVVFVSLSSDLAPGPIDPAVFNLYAYDVASGTTALLTVGVGGVPSNGNSFAPQVTPDGRRVIMASFASNLTAGGDLSAGRDLFVIDRTTGTTVMANLNSSGVQANGTGVGSFSIDAAGRFVTFRSDGTNLVASDTNGLNDLFRRDMLTGQTTLVSIGFDGSPADGATAHTSAQSQDGTVVVFGSVATNLVASDTNGFGDIFARFYPLPLPGDLNGDGAVNGADLGLVLGSWGGTGGDLNGDGTTDGADLGIVLGGWTG